jgi:uncharacterized membrane protein
MPEETKKTDGDTSAVSKQDVNVGMGIVAYLIFFIPLLTDSKDDPFVKFHVKQGLNLLIFAVVGSVVSGIIPVIGWFILGPIISIASLVLGIMGIINAANKEMKELPLIGKYAAQYLKF